MYTILHVESSKFVHDMVRDVIKEKGCVYLETDSYNEALMVLEENDVDLILTSTKALGMDVHDFIKEVKYQYKGVPICIVTASSNVKPLIDAGANNYIPKNDLINELQRYIDEKVKVHLQADILQDKSIAIIDDSPLARLQVKEMLQGYDIEDVSYFEGGSDLFKANRNFDIYLIDMILKDEYGTNIITKVREENSSAKIIAMTALDNPDTLAEVLDYGADDIVNKPLSEKFLISKLKARVRK